MPINTLEKVDNSKKDGEDEEKPVITVKCNRCGRLLKDPNSIARGMGKRCHEISTSQLNQT